MCVTHGQCNEKWTSVSFLLVENRRLSGSPNEKHIIHIYPPENELENVHL